MLLKRLMVYGLMASLGCADAPTGPGGGPDSGEIIFAGFGGNTASLFGARPDGSGLRQLTYGPGLDYYPRFSPSGHTLAFLRIGEADTYQVWLLDMTTLATSQLSHDTLRKNGGLSWSPDGSRMVVAAAETTEARFDLYLLDVATRTIRNLTIELPSDGGERNFLFPDWSVHDEIVFAKNDSLYWIAPTGTVLRKRYYGGAAALPRWSADGESIAFTHFAESTSPARGRIAIVDRWGDGFRLVTDEAGNAIAPAWSPSGREIAYASNRDGDFDIFVVPAAGGVARRLAKRPGEDGVPAWHQPPAPAQR